MPSSQQQQQLPNAVNPAFAMIYEGITGKMPAITFYGIIVTYLITAALNVYFIPLPVYISIPAALAIQFGRFAIVFMDFLNPTGKRSHWPAMIATVATLISLAELSYSIQDIGWTGPKFWSVLLFGGLIIGFGYVLEINFIAKGAEAFGMTTARTVGAQMNQLNQPQTTAQDEELKLLYAAMKDMQDEMTRMRQLTIPFPTGSTNGKHVGNP